MRWCAALARAGDRSATTSKRIRDPWAREARKEREEARPGQHRRTASPRQGLHCAEQGARLPSALQGLCCMYPTCCKNFTRRYMAAQGFGHRRRGWGRVDSRIYTPHTHGRQRAPSESARGTVSELALIHPAARGRLEGTAGGPFLPHDLTPFTAGHCGLADPVA